MLLSELEQGAKVLLLLTIDGKHFEFETIVQGKHKHDVLFEPIRKDQKILNVQSLLLFSLLYPTKLLRSLQNIS